MDRPKIRDGKQILTRSIYPLNEFPEEIIHKIGSYFVYLIFTGRKDIDGRDWGDAFAEAIGGIHLDSPVGIADVILDKNCWSMKTVKQKKPFDAKTLRLISGRCSPDFSYGITDPHTNIQRTGEAVLSIWNERINVATDHYTRVRTAILVRSEDLLSYKLFEEETTRFRTTDYHWIENKQGNLLGYDENEKHCFTWQPHGAQFTIMTDVPKVAAKFKLKKPPVMSKEKALEMIEFSNDWITIIE